MLKKPAFNSGPWLASSDDRSAIWSVRTPTLSICEIHGYGPISEANARLIAAAPDMYEALKDFLWFGRLEIMCGDQIGLEHAFNKVGAAIVKAEGRA
jgi:hypothetical protein